MLTTHLLLVPWVRKEGLYLLSPSVPELALRVTFTFFLSAIC
jgi:hypothetical protein